MTSITPIAGLLIIGSLFISVFCQVPPPIIKSLNVNCDILYKYATTQISSRILNPANVSQEVNFRVTLPEEAFITHFVMVLKGKPYEAYIKEKEEAKKDYDAAVGAGQSAGHIFQTSSRFSKDFTVSVNLAAEEKGVFNVTYEELLTRKNGTYKTEINIEPRQIVPDLSIIVNIEDVLTIKNIKVPQFKMSNEIDQSNAENPNAKKQIISPNKVRVEWNPSKKEQKKLNAEGLNGQMIVEYDVDASNNSQQILIDEDGYFVHILRNDLLPVLNKHVVFVLDVSGSMSGSKIEQVKQAMVKILSDLSEKDYFSIVLFSDAITPWKTDGFDISPLSSYSNINSPVEEENIIPANKDNVKYALNFIRNLRTFGSTNINGGLRISIELAKLGKKKLHNAANPVEPMIIFLTDGEPNVEESDPDKIIDNVGERNTDKVSIFSLAFGFSADLKFLKKLSLANNGFSRRIYESSDAALQLNNFYYEVASPVLSDVKFEYLPEKVEDKTAETKNLFSGSEIFVIGKVKPNSTVSGTLSAITTEGRKTFPIPAKSFVLPSIERKSNKTTTGHLEKMWAFKTIKSLLDQNTLLENDTLKKKAKDLALKYKFVTPLTSLVVVKPNVTSVVDDEHQGLRSAGISTGPSRSFLQAPVFGISASGSGPFYMLNTGGRTSGDIHSLSISAPRMRTKYNMRHMPISSVAGLKHVTILSNSTSSMMHNYSSPGNMRLIPYGNVTWLNLTISDDGLFIKPPPEVDRNDVIALNETNVSTTKCSNGNACKHFVYCSLSIFTDDFHDYLPFKCHIDPRFLGVCCPF